MHELAVTDIHANVRDSSASGVEEYQVARLHVVVRYRVASVVLFRRGARQRHTLPSVDVLRKPGAIEAARPGHTPAVRRAAVRERGTDNVIRSRGRFGFGPNVVSVVAAAAVNYRQLSVAPAPLQLHLLPAQVVRQRFVLVAVQPMRDRAVAPAVREGRDMLIMAPKPRKLQLLAVEVVRKRLVLMLAQAVDHLVAVFAVAVQDVVRGEVRTVAVKSGELNLLPMKVVGERFILVLAAAMHDSLMLLVVLRGV